MSFRTRVLLVGLLGNLIVWGGYFGWIGLQIARTGFGSVPPLGSLFGVIVWLIIYSTVAAGAVELLVRAGAAERTRPLDERERAVSAYAGSVAYTLLSVFVLLVIGGMFFGWSTTASVHMLLLAVIAAETVRYGSELLALRR